jgi:hypothetical protein
VSLLHAPAPPVGYDLGGYLQDTLYRFPPAVRREGISRDPRLVTCQRCLKALSEHVQWHNRLMAEARGKAGGA